ncbi:MAG: hypothetical protein ACE14P_00250 [Methanotrichaceae archaeon]
MHNIKRIMFIGILLSVYLLGGVGFSLSKENPVVVNLMLDADINHAPTPDQVKIAGSSLINLTNEIDPRGLNTTIFVTGDIVSAYRLGITLQGTMSNHELALHGNVTDEKLSSMSDADQEALLTKAKDLLYHCYVCGGKHVDIKGFRPQAFDQNNATFKVLEKLGIIYDAGFQEGIIYMPGHETDAWPYLIDGSNLTAVPASTYELSGERVYLYDRYVKENKKLSGAQWYDLLVKKFEESAKDGVPMVVIFSNLVSGNGDYLDAYRNFLDYATSKEANFVTTMQLVNMAAVKGGKPPALISQSSNAEKINTSETGVIKGCPTCDQTKTGLAQSIINVSIKKNKNCTTCNQSSTNVTK